MYNLNLFSFLMHIDSNILFNTYSNKSVIFYLTYEERGKRVLSPNFYTSEIFQFEFFFKYSNHNI